MGNAGESAAGRRLGGQDELPECRVTANMVIGYNVAYFRRAAGLTQEQLGEPLGWTKVAVSAAERSWDGKRVRKFDADEILRIAQVLGLPIAALFLPPEDDGRDKRYIIGEGGHGQPTAMQGLLEFAMSEPTQDDRPVMQAYENRLVSAVSKYLPSGAAEAVATRLKQRTTEQQLARALREARANHEILDRFYDTIDELIKDNNLLQDFLVAMLRATPEGQALAGRPARGERAELADEGADGGDGKRRQPSEIQHVGEESLAAEVERAQ